MIEHALAEQLDAWAEHAFGGADGATRLQPLLSRWDREVGHPRGEDDDAEAWITSRTDWALVDMGGGAHVVGADPVRALLARSWVGVFEVWPGEGGVAWLRDRLGGAAMTLSRPIDLRPSARGPTALWELRGVLADGTWHALRAPIAYPIEVAALLDACSHDAGGAGLAPDPSRPPRLLQALRRARLWHARADRVDPRPRFRAAIEAAIDGDAG